MSLSVSSDNFIFFCVIAAISVGSNASTRRIEHGIVAHGRGWQRRLLARDRSGQAWRRTFVSFYSGLEHSCGYLAASNRHTRKDPSSHRLRSAFSRRNRRRRRVGTHLKHARQDLRALLERLGVRRPVLIGWSQGGSGRRRLCRAVRHQRSRGNCAGGCCSFRWCGRHGRSIPWKPAEQFKMFAVYQAHQKEYLEGMMHAIISKPQSDDVIQRLVSTGMKTPSDIGVGMLVADMFGVNRTQR